MRLVLQRGIGDCGIAALATWLEQTYEDVFVEAAKVDHKRRGKSGIYLTGLQQIARAFGVRLALKRTPIAWDDDEGLLVVRWARGSRHVVGLQHLVVLAHGVIVDPADGVILPADEYLARERAQPGALLVEA